MAVGLLVKKYAEDKFAAMLLGASYPGSDCTRGAIDINASALSPTMYQVKKCVFRKSPTKCVPENLFSSVCR